MPTMYREIEAAEQEVEYLKRFYLRRWGWVETSETPGSYSLWWRDFTDLDAKRKAFHDAHPTTSKPRAYGIVWAATDLAISITVRCLDEQPECETNEAA